MKLEKGILKCTCGRNTDFYGNAILQFIIKDGISTEYLTITCKACGQRYKKLPEPIIELE